MMRNHSQDASLPQSPLTGTTQVSWLRTLETAELIEAWQRMFQIDVTPEFHGQQTIFLYECQQTKLKFFLPAELTGSEQLYQQLQANVSWYYDPWRWEHDIARQDVRACQRVLEIGCGTGGFLKRLQQEYQLQVQGIELNSAAARIARQEGISVEQTDLSAFAAQYPETFDAVCAFQVLEHVNDPQTFLRSIIRLLKPHGRLILTVPNADSFRKYAQQPLILDMPPHHMTRWCQTTFEALPSLLPVTCQKILFQPLAASHVEFYASIQMDRWADMPLLRKFARPVAVYVLHPLLMNSARLRACIRGHTMYALFKKD